MKKFSVWRNRLLHRARTEKNLQERLRRRERRKRAQGKPTPRNAPTNSLFVGKRILIAPPREIELNTSLGYEEIMSVVRALREHALNQGNKVSLDLTECQSFRATAVLKLHVELDIISNSSPISNIVTVRWPKNQDVKHALLAHGFFGSGTTLDKAGHLPITSGTDAKGNPERLSRMNHCLFSNKLVMHDQPWQDLHAAITEALLNVRQHAYDHPDRKTFLTNFGPKWWLMGNTFDDQLHLVIYDKGIGIPRSLGAKSSKEQNIFLRYARRIMGAAGGSTDGGLVAAAMIYGRSRLKQRHGGGGHGKGLTDIKHWVTQNPEGELTIFSNRGKYIYTTKSDRVDIVSHISSIHGTLIQWNLRLQ